MPLTDAQLTQAYTRCGLYGSNEGYLSEAEVQDLAVFAGVLDDDENLVVARQVTLYVEMLRVMQVRRPEYGDQFRQRIVELLRGPQGAAPAGSGGGLSQAQVEQIVANQLAAHARLPNVHHTPPSPGGGGPAVDQTARDAAAANSSAIQAVDTKADAAANPNVSVDFILRFVTSAPQDGEIRHTGATFVINSDSLHEDLMRELLRDAAAAQGRIFVLQDPGRFIQGRITSWSDSSGTFTVNYAQIAAQGSLQNGARVTATVSWRPRPTDTIPVASRHTDSEIQALARGQITDANIPSSIARDSEIPDVTNLLDQARVDGRIDALRPRLTHFDRSRAQIPANRRIPSTWNGRLVDVNSGAGATIALITQTGNTSHLPDAYFEAVIRKSGGDADITVGNVVTLSAVGDWCRVLRIQENNVWRTYFLTGHVAASGGGGPPADGSVTEAKLSAGVRGLLLPPQPALGSRNGKSPVYEGDTLRYVTQQRNVIQVTSLPARGDFVGQIAELITLASNPRRTFRFTGTVRPGEFDATGAVAGFERFIPTLPAASDIRGNLDAFAHASPLADVAWLCLADAPLGDWDTANWEAEPVYLHYAAGGGHNPGVGGTHTGYDTNGNQVQRTFANLQPGDVFSARHMVEMVRGDAQGRTRYYRRESGGWTEVLDDARFTDTTTHTITVHMWNGTAWVNPLGAGGGTTLTHTPTEIYAPATPVVMPSSGSQGADTNLDIKSGSTRYTWAEFDEIEIVFVATSGSDRDYQHSNRGYTARFNAVGDTLGTFERGSRGIQYRGASSFRTFAWNGWNDSVGRLWRIIGWKTTIS